MIVTYFFTNYIAAWIDLLGQTAELEQIPLIPHSPEEHESFIKTLKPTFGRVQAFRKLVEDAHTQMTKPLSLPSESYSDNQRAVFKKHTTSNVSFSFIADSALMIISLHGDQDSIPPVYSIYTLFEHLSLMILSSLAGSAPLRGAMELGVCSKFDDGSLYGQAISRAHSIESKRTHYPRIIIGPNLANYLDIIIKECQESSLSIPEKNLLLLWSSNIKESCEYDTYDGQLILSYLKLCKKRADQDQKSYEKLLKRASCFIDQSLSEYRTVGDVKLSERYSLLKKYFQQNNCWMAN